MNLYYRCPNLTSVYRIEVSDFIYTIVSIPISYDASAPVIDKEPTVSNYFVKVSKVLKTTCPFPAGTFYEILIWILMLKTKSYIFMMRQSGLHYHRRQ
jgi:hypothetical protein